MNKKILTKQQLFIHFLKKEGVYEIFIPILEKEFNGSFDLINEKTSTFYLFNYLRLVLPYKTYEKVKMYLLGKKWDKYLDDILKKNKEYESFLIFNGSYTYLDDLLKNNQGISVKEYIKECDFNTFLANIFVTNVRDLRHTSKLRALWLDYIKSLDSLSNPYYKKTNIFKKLFRLFLRKK